LLSIRTIAIYLAVFGMELCCLFAVLKVANQSVNNQLSIAGLLVILVLSFAIFKILHRLIKFSRLVTMMGWILLWPLVTLGTIKIMLFGQTPLRDSIWLSSVPLAFSKILTSFEPALLLIICTALLWWLGQRLAVKKWGFPATVSEFQFGLIVLVLIYFIAYILESEMRTALPVTLLFFTCGLAGISISHDQTSRGWFNSPGQWHWSVILLVSVGLILLAGMIVSLLVSPEMIHLIIRGLKWLWDVFEKFMQWLASLFPSSTHVEEMPPIPGMPGGEIPPESHPFHFPEWLVSGFKIFWSVMIISLSMLAIWRITSQIFAWMRGKAGGSGGESESLRVAFWQDWLNWLKRLYSSILRIKWSRTALPKSAITGEAASVRQIYAQWLKRMASSGYPRRKEQTPLEYQHGVKDILDSQKEALEAITGQYIQVRYGAATPSDIEIEKMKEQWSVLKKADLKHTE
jgi:hypothetical protein